MQEEIGVVTHWLGEEGERRFTRASIRNSAKTDILILTNTILLCRIIFQVAKYLIIVSSLNQAKHFRHQVVDKLPLMNCERHTFLSQYKYCSYFTVCFRSTNIFQLLLLFFRQLSYLSGGETFGGRSFGGAKPWYHIAKPWNHFGGALFFLPRTYSI